MTARRRELALFATAPCRLESHRMATLRRWLFLWLALLISANRLAAATGEDRAYTNALKPFVDGVWELAETELTQFVEKYPQSPHRAEAVLRQARAQFNQRKFEQAIALLTARQAEADKLADEYLYWRAEAHFQNTNYTAAADLFGKLTGGFPTSPRRLEASVREAAARAKQGDWPRTAELLQNPNGSFRQAAQTNSNNEFFVRGLLLLGEAQLAQKHYPEAEAALQPIANSKLKLDLDWQRRYLICRAQLAAGRTEEAKGCGADLLSLAEATGRQELIAESIAFRGGALEQLGQREEARAMFQRNATNGPVELQRQAILKIGELALAQDQLAETIQTLETFLGRFSNSPTADVALLTLGELHLKLHVSPALTNRVAPATAVAATNHWQLALTNFDRVLSVSSNGVLVGKAQLGRGWCYWISNMIPESVAAFKAATTQLPPSEDLAVARFKLADGLLMQKDFGGAVTNYQGALQAATDLPRVKDVLTPRALYQMLQANLGLKDLVGAEEVMRRILEAYLHSAEADRSVLLVGQGYADVAKPEQARALFKEFVERFPNSVLRPEVELAVAQTHEQQSGWPTAIGAYDAWLNNFGTNRLRPQAEFYRALAYFHAGSETNTLMQLTNFVAQYATNDLAPLAQRWVADYYYRKGGEFYLAAETSYKGLFQTWSNSPLTFEAQMMAGRAASGRQDYPAAIGYFTNLTSTIDPNCPRELKIQARFAYGSALLLQTNTSASLKLAIQVYGTIFEFGTNTEQAALAWGEIGDCYFQLGAQEERYYESASNAYLRVASSPYAGVPARSRATIGLALVAEKRAEAKTGDERTALLKLARDYYLDVFYEANLRDGETRDLFWVKKAGLEAARIAESESFQEWSQAEKFYDRLLRLLPQMKETLEKKRAKVQAHLERREN